MWTSQQILVYLVGIVCICITYFNDHLITSSVTAFSIGATVSYNITVSKSCQPGHCSRSTNAAKCCFSLKAAVNIVQDYETIYVDSGEYSGIANTGLCGGIRNCTFTGVSLIGKSETGVSIVGTNQDSLTRALHIHDSSFSLIANLTYRNFRLSDGDSSQSSGGALFIENSTVVLTRVRFLENFSGYGGALSVSRSTITIEDCVFNGNHVYSTGGSISAISTNLTVVRSTFYNNSASSRDNELSAFGGAISFISQQDHFIYVSDSSFQYNTAQRSGGAIGIQPQGLSQGPSFVYIGKSIFIENTANGRGACVSTSSCNTIGGAVYVNAANVTFEDNRFDKNSVQTVSTPNVGEGGAIFIANILGTRHRTGITRIMGCNFTSNYAIGTGGAIQILNQDFLIINSLFHENLAYTLSPFFDNSPSAGAALWFSAQGLQGEIRNTLFWNNTAFSGWAGAIFVTGNTQLNIYGSQFLANGAISSYTNTGQGGAIMVSSGSTLRVDGSVFSLNAAMPKVRVSPQTYSGEGGAIFAQSSQIFLTRSNFSSNYAITGQFDAGSAGGAVLLEDCYPAVIKKCVFEANGAVGYLGRSTYASCGTGGGIYVKFSAADISGSEFFANWVSAGGSQNSIGGGIAINFDYSSVSGYVHGVTINDTVFHNNSAYSQICYFSQSGQGAAIGIIGASVPPIRLHHVNFTYNRAQSSQSSTILSAGGAFTMSQQSNVTAIDCLFSKNAAFFGVGDDIASVAGENMKENFLMLHNAHFESASVKELDDSYQDLISVGQKICNQVQKCLNGQGPVCNYFNVGGQWARRRLAVEEMSSFDGLFYVDMANIFNTIEGMEWLSLKTPISLDVKADEELATIPFMLEIFDKHRIPVTRPTSKKAKDNEGKDILLPLTPREEDQVLLQNVIQSVEDLLSAAASTSSSSSIAGAWPLSEVEEKTVRLLLQELKAVREEEFPGWSKVGETSALDDHYVALDFDATSSFDNFRRIPVDQRIDIVRPYSEQVTSFRAQLGPQDTFGSSSKIIDNSAFKRHLAANFPTDESLKTFITFRPGIVITSGLGTLYSPTFHGPYYIFCGDYASIDSAKSLNTYTIDPTSSPFYAEVVLTGSIRADELTLTIFHSDVIFDMPMETSDAMSIKQINIFNGTLKIANNIHVTESSYFYESTIVGVPNQHMTSYMVPYPDYHPHRTRSTSTMASTDTTDNTNGFNTNETTIEQVNANITFYKNVFTGYQIEQLSGHKNFAKRTILIEKINNHNNKTINSTGTETIITFENCAVIMKGKMYLDSPFRSIYLANVTNIDDKDYTKSIAHNAGDIRYLVNTILKLTKNATLIINEGGTLALLTASVVRADSPDLPAIINYGNISLLGTTGSLFSEETKVPTPNRGAQVASWGSLTSTLIVEGELFQYKTGLMNVILNTSFQIVPVISLQSNRYLSGSLAVTFFSNAELFEDDTLPAIIYPDLVLYDTNNPSTFEVIRYHNYTTIPDVTIPISVAAPDGLKFKPLIDFIVDDVASDIPSDRNESASVYVQSLQIENIGCNHLTSYYYHYAKDEKSSSYYPCHICLSNSSCELCSDGSCSVKGTCPSGVRYSGTCCTPECVMPYGKCQANGEDNGGDDYDSFICSCTWFYTGDTCHRLSTYGIITIFSGIFIIVTSILSLFLYHRALQQKNKVLEELKEGILRHTESGNNEYIQTMQQALILNDVFVKFDEIKLESQIGEGSFGVVHKATFRGAQVAVKQMRSMFLELTEKDIEEFRKEAYMMSRLRHPNIVLVMGISLVDQEPIPLPKSRSMMMIPSNDNDGASSPFLSGAADGSKKGSKQSKPQKTVCIITEYLEQGSLADILYGPTRLPAEIWTYELILTCALQAARGMLYLHSHHPPICHRDLKSSNLVVDDHWVVKVTDFGMSRIVPEKVQEQEKGITEGEEDPLMIGRDSMADGSEGSVMVPVTTTSSNATKESGARVSISALSNQNHIALEMTSNLGTTAWCAPELLTASSRTRYSVKVDVYSFGMVLWELWEKKRPFEEYTSRFDIMDAVRAGKRPIISENCPPTFKSLITRCWHSEPSRRPTFNYIVRYLKDELARVKRNKAMSLQQQAAAGGGGAGGYGGMLGFGYGGGSGGNGAGSGNGGQGGQGGNGQTNRSSLMSNYFRPSFSQVHQNLSTRSSDVGLTGSGNQGSGNNTGSGRGGSMSGTNSTGAPARRSSGTSSAMTNSVSSAVSSTSANSETVTNPMITAPSTTTPSTSTAKPEATPNGSFSSSAPVPIRGSITEGDLPEGRTPLVKAFDRSLSYLTESPSLQSPIQQQNFQKYSANQAWRDRYVMKFSGWNSSNPDSGLPPTRASVSSMTPEIPVPGARMRSSMTNLPPSINPTMTISSNAGSTSPVRNNGAANNAAPASTSVSSTDPALLQARSPPTTGSSPVNTVGTPVDSQPIFPLDQDPAGGSATMNQIRRGITDMADDIRAQNNSL